MIDPPPALSNHPSAGELGADECAREVGAEDRIEILIGHLEQVLGGADAMVDDHDVEPAESVHGRRDQAFHIGAPGGVAGHGAGRAAGVGDVGSDGIEVRPAASGEHHVRAGARQGLGHLGAEAAARAGDERGAAAEIEGVGRHRFLLPQVAT